MLLLIFDIIKYSANLSERFMCLIFWLETLTKIIIFLEKSQCFGPFFALHLPKFTTALCPFKTLQNKHHSHHPQQKALAVCGTQWKCRISTFLKTEPKWPHNSKTKTQFLQFGFQKPTLAILGCIFTLSHLQFIFQHDCINSQRLKVYLFMPYLCTSSSESLFADN